MYCECSLIELYTKNMGVKKEQQATISVWLKKQLAEMYSLLQQVRISPPVISGSSQPWKYLSTNVFSRLIPNCCRRWTPSVKASLRRTFTRHSAANGRNAWMRVSKPAGGISKKSRLKMWPLIPNKELLISYFLEFHFLTGVPVFPLVWICPYKYGFFQKYRFLDFCTNFF